MSENLDVLLSIAEISVAFAGFAGIITAISGRDQAVWDPGNTTRFRVMVYGSLSATVMALMPYVFLLNFEQVDWTLSVGVFAIYLLIFSTVMIRGFIRQRKALKSSVSIVISCLLLAATVTQILAFVGVLAADLGIYYFGVFCLFIQSTIAFVRLITQAILRQGSSSTG